MAALPLSGLWFWLTAHPLSVLLVLAVLVCLYFAYRPLPWHKAQEWEQRLLPLFEVGRVALTFLIFFGSACVGRK